MNLTLVVLAAGIGSRYGGLKQMIPVGPSGEYLLDYGVYDALQAGFGRIVFIIRREIERDFEEVMGTRLKQQAEIGYVFQEASVPASAPVPAARERPLGTGHALWCCRDAVDGPFAVMNADDFYGRGSYLSLASFLKDTADDESQYAMVGFILRNTLSDYGSVARGICTARDNRTFKHIVETVGIEKSGDNITCPNRAFSGDELVSMNLWGFKSAFFGYLRRSSLSSFVSTVRIPKRSFTCPVSLTW